MGARITKDLQLQLQNATPDHLRIEELEETGRELGKGSYGSVVEVRHKGTLCACKRVHEVFVEDRENRIVEKFRAECERMGKLRHPNIVQSLGIYFDRSRDAPPSLVMELLPLSLDKLLKQYKEIPNHIKTSILLDVSRALLYLHMQSPPIMHRDLTVYNVLLTRGLCAKLSDFGVARDLRNFSGGGGGDEPPLSMVPGHNLYMPPEAKQENPDYDLSIDVYSFGNLIVHVVSGRCPDEVNEGKYTTIYTGEKQDVEKIAESPLKTLAEQCLEEDRRQRPSTERVVIVMEWEYQREPAPYSHAMELLDQLREKEEEVRVLWSRLGGQATEVKKQPHLNPIEEAEEEMVEVKGFGGEQNGVADSSTAVSPPPTPDASGAGAPQPLPVPKPQSRVNTMPHPQPHPPVLTHHPPAMPPVLNGQTPPTHSPQQAVGYAIPQQSNQTLQDAAQPPTPKPRVPKPRVQPPTTTPSRQAAGETAATGGAQAEKHNTLPNRPQSTYITLSPPPELLAEGRGRLSTWPRRPRQRPAAAVAQDCAKGASEELAAKLARRRNWEHN